MATLTNLVSENALVDAGAAGVAMNIPDAMHEATRYMCAAVYNNRQYRSRVLQELLHEKFRATTSCYGVHLPTLLYHSLAARRRMLLRNLALVSCTLLLVLFPRPIGYICALCATWSIVAFESYSRRRFILAGSLSKVRFRLVDTPDERRSSGGDSDPNRDSIPLIVHGSYGPFAGCGFRLDNWSIAVNTNKGREEFGVRKQPKEFAIGELYQRIQIALTALKLPSCHIDHVVCVHGRDLRNTDSRFFEGPLHRPRLRVPTDTLAIIDNDMTQPARHYLRAQCLAWHGELVFFMFLRFQQASGSLFAECATTLLTPIREDYRSVDSMDPAPPARALALATLGALILAPVQYAASLFIAILAAGEIAARFFKRWRDRRSILRIGDFNYGPRQCIRELASSQTYQRYFQHSDKELYTKVLERQVIDVLIEFLDEKGVDTSDLRRRLVVVENRGVVMSGGEIRADSLAVGSAARARSNRYHTSGVVEMFEESRVVDAETKE